MTADDIERGKQIFESGKYSAPTEYATVLDEVKAWFKRFIYADDEDLDILALFNVHTHLARECFTSLRLQLDSAMPNSGKTTVCEHLHHLAYNPYHFAVLSSTPLLVRILQKDIATLLIDEADRSLDADKTGVKDMMAVINSGYKMGATRPVLVPGKGGGQWEVEDMSTYAPVVLSGNAPHLPDDTRSRCIRILLTPDFDGVAEDSDWEEIEDEANALHLAIEVFAESVREQVKTTKVTLPTGCRTRMREKWRPLKRVAVAAGGRWPAVCDMLTVRDMAEEEADRMDGFRTIPPAAAVMNDLYEIWSETGILKLQPFVPTKELVKRLAFHNPEQWGESSNYGKRLTEHRLGRMVTQVAKTHSTRIEHNGARGYRRVDLIPGWKRLGIMGKGQVDPSL